MTWLLKINFTQNILLETIFFVCEKPSAYLQRSKEREGEQIDALAFDDNEMKEVMITFTCG